jgi:hypothetical protein
MEDTVSSEISVDTEGSSAYYDPSWREMVKQYRQRVKCASPSPFLRFPSFSLFGPFLRSCALSQHNVSFDGCAHRWRRILTLPLAILTLSYFCIFLFFLYISYGLISQFGHYADPIRDLGTARHTTFIVTRSCPSLACYTFVRSSHHAISSLASAGLIMPISLVVFAAAHSLYVLGWRMALVFALLSLVITWISEEIGTSFVPLDLTLLFPSSSLASSSALI